MENIKLGIVAAEFNYEITYAMVELAKEHAKFLGVTVEDVVKVPGVFDMPLAVKMLLERCDINCVVTLGAVIEGQTEHDEIVAGHATRKIADLALDYNKPVGLGISGPGMSRLDAHKRIDYAKKAVEAAVKMCRVLAEGGAGGCNCGGGEKPDEGGDDREEHRAHASSSQKKRIIETG
jgi:6,7-dimethyl-8-ribityllumazine synthase